MDFLLTKYVYPLERATTPFWDNIYFDNPRNSTEIEIIANFLKRVITSNIKGLAFSEDDLSHFLKDFFQKKSINKNLDMYDDIYHKLASIWIIVRYNSSGDKDFPNLLDSSIEKTQRIMDFLCFIEFGNLCRPSDTLLISDSFNMEYSHTINTNELLLFFNLFAISQESEVNPEDDCWVLPFDNILSRIQSKIDLIKELENDTQFNYIADQIFRLNNLTYEYDKIICLVSLFELFIAHKPDTNRFNVEESIKKMFINKTLLLLYLNDNTINQNHIKKELSLIYDIRSDIAHGNFSDLNNSVKKINNLYKNEMHLEPYFDNSDFDNNKIPEQLILSTSVRHLKNYLKIILNTYLKDPNIFLIIKNL